MVDDLGALAAVPVLSALTADQLRGLARVSTSRTVAAGTVVAAQGAPAERLIVVERGALTAAYDTLDGRRLRLGEFRAPCAVDKTAMLDGSGHTATWHAATRADIRLIPAAAFLTLLDDVPAARHHVLRTLAQQTRDQRDALVSAHFADATSRAADWLLRAAGRTGKARVILPGAQQGLAEALGVTRVSVNRALRTLAAEGLIRIETGAVTILAAELLARRAAGQDAVRA